MSTTTDIDRLAAAWLADGPAELSDRVLDAALREVHQTHQRRALASWRTFQMSFFSTALGRATAAVVAVAVVLGGAIYLVSRGPSIGGPAQSQPRSPAPSAVASPTLRPSAAPSAAPSPTPLPAATVITSSAYGYRIRIPAGWTVTLASQPWDGTSAVGHDDPIVDQLDPPEQTGRCQHTFLCAPINWAYARSWAGDLASWAAYIDMADARDHPCPSTPETVDPTTIDGAPALIEAKHCEPVTGILILAALTVRNGTAYVFYSQDQSRDRTVEPLDRTDLETLIAGVTLP